ncbi:MAG: hypothetical protein AAGC54_11130 [Cyanobacteria bacterium P01_F01_bin.4]
MAFSKFTLKQVKTSLGIEVIENQRLFSLDIPPVAISDYLKTTLDEFAPLALSINTEKSRSEWIIAPILAELRRDFKEQISLFSGISWGVEPAQGLDGFCDFIISREPEQLYLSAPVMIITEAKKEDIIGGIGQCLATMYAAQLFNEQEGQHIPQIYGTVTTGTNWKFLKLAGKTAVVDRDEYSLREIDRLMGILVHMVEASGLRVPVS